MAKVRDIMQKNVITIEKTKKPKKDPLFVKIKKTIFQKAEKKTNQ